MGNGRREGVRKGRERGGRNGERKKTRGVRKGREKGGRNGEWKKTRR